MKIQRLYGWEIKRRAIKKEAKPMSLPTGTRNTNRKNHGNGRLSFFDKPSFTPSSFTFF
jgi:hypothetical protein